MTRNHLVPPTILCPIRCHPPSTIGATHQYKKPIGATHRSLPRPCPIRCHPPSTIGATHQYEKPIGATHRSLPRPCTIRCHPPSTIGATHRSLPRPCPVRWHPPSQIGATHRSVHRSVSARCPIWCHSPYISRSIREACSSVFGISPNPGEGNVGELGGFNFGPARLVVARSATQV